MIDFNKRFSLLKSDIALAQRAALIVSFISDYIEENKADLDDYHYDEFLKSTVVTHKVSGIIALHKIFDTDKKTQSINFLMSWLKKNGGQFEISELRKRKMQIGLSQVEADKFVESAHHFTKQDFDQIYSRKSKLQKLHDGQVKDLRNRSYAHREDIDTELYPDLIKPVKVKTVKELACGADGIFEDIWMAYYNGLPFSGQDREYWNKDKVFEHTKRYLDVYRRSKK